MSIPFVILITLIMSAFFSGMEIAFISANRLRIELDKKQGSLNSRIVNIFVNNPNQYIATMLVGNNIALVIYGLAMAIMLEPLILKFTNSDSSILLIQTIISTLIILFTAEFLPKTIFRINPNLALNAFAVPIMCFYILFYPIALFTIFLSNTFLKKFLKVDIDATPQKLVFGKTDLDHLLSEGISDSLIMDSKEHEIKMFQNALDFPNLKIRDCMIPRTDITAVDVNSSIEDLKNKFIETGYSKILVYDDKIDNIIGYITHKELFKNPEDIRSKLLEVSFVPETMQARNLLTDFIQNRKSIAVVVDEFGGVSGMLTIEDIIEEIFGDIEDEHDITELIDTKISETEFVFSGRQEIEHINEKYELGLPESDEYETIAGLIIFYTEKLPQINEIIILEKFQFKILKVTQTKIELVRVDIVE